ncbi:MAG: molybdopterin-guanine dinucleotide biosynthesis protein B [Candidatus Hydrothermarchaeales archaeon]
MKGKDLLLPVLCSIMDMIAVIGAGRHSGKTTAVEALVRELKKRGLKVGTIKQIHEQDFSIDKRGKDSWRHVGAGADVVVTASPAEVAAIKRIPGKDRFQEAVMLLDGQNLDIVIVEGHPGISVPMVYAARGEGATKAKPIDDNVICIVSLTPENFHESRLPVYHIIKESPRIADLVLKKLEKGERGAGE